MEEISQEQFKLDHLRKRFAQMTVEYEDRLAEAAVHTQVFKQAAEAATARVQELEAQIAELKADDGDDNPEEPGLEAVPDRN